MKNRFVTLAAAFLVLSACNATTQAPSKADKPPSKADEFKKATIAQCKASFNKLYKADLNEGNVKVMSAQDVDKWIKDGPWKTRDLPCEIKNILVPGNVDPSPIALDISGSAPKTGTHLVYIPIRSVVNCPSPKSGFFLDDAECSDTHGFVCEGGVGKNCTCSCKWDCSAPDKLCDSCP